MYSNQLAFGSALETAEAAAAACGAAPSAAADAGTRGGAGQAILPWETGRHTQDQRTPELVSKKVYLVISCRACYEHTEEHCCSLGKCQASNPNEKTGKKLLFFHLR